jgi:CHASE3 domain sensor protein
MRQSLHDLRSDAIDRALARNAENRSRAAFEGGVFTLVVGFALPCMLIGAAIVAATIVLTRIYLM